GVAGDDRVLEAHRPGTGVEDAATVAGPVAGPVCIAGKVIANRHVGQGVRSGEGSGVEAGNATAISTRRGPADGAVGDRHVAASRLNTAAIRRSRIALYRAVGQRKRTAEPGDATACAPVSPVAVY